MFISFALILVDIGPAMNGLSETVVAVSYNEDSLKTFCKSVYGKEVGKPEPFEPANYYIIKPKSIAIV